MSIERHMENRAWAFQALDELDRFTEDPDFQGDAEEERTTIDKKRRELREGKYRVVFLGAFNVGKSTMINAFLGDEYLPTILEECTTKITHVIESEELSVVIHLSSAVTEDELRALSDLLGAFSVGVNVTPSEDWHAITITFDEPTNKLLNRSLRALTTFAADEDFPQLRPLRDKYEELFIYLPNNSLEEDISLVDSPGVYSISETNQRVAQGIIPDSHLVVCMLDSHNAGNEQSRDFIEQLVKERHRKVFFVINKSDQLTEDEIDPAGRRGPAKDLQRSLDGVVNNPELFFVSSLYALVAEQLERGSITLESIEQNSKIHIPYGVYRDLRESENPEQSVAAWLRDRSNFNTLRSRLHDYLYTENKEGAVLDSVCRFIDGRAWKYARPLEVQLELAQTVPRLDELDRGHQERFGELQRRERHEQETLEAYDRMATGGEVSGVNYPGYEGLLENQLKGGNIDSMVLKPLRSWLDNDDNLRKAKRSRYEAFAKEIETRVEALLSESEVALNHEVESIERQTLDRAGDPAASVRQERCPRVRAEAPKAGAMAVPMGGSYFAWMVMWAVIFAVIGGAAGWMVYDQYPLDNYIIYGTDIAITQQVAGIGGAIDGAIVGAILGLIFRGMTANGVRRKKLREIMEERVNAMVLGAPGAQESSLRAQLASALSERRQLFRGALKRAFDKFTGVVREDISVLESEQRHLREEQRLTVDRLDPKLTHLRDLGGRAHEVAEKGVAANPAA
jgi:GTP-binding protein EngB required for normal cell division/gas vesicle protein